MPEIVDHPRRGVPPALTFEIESDLVPELRREAAKRGTSVPVLGIARALVASSRPDMADVLWKVGAALAGPV